MALRPVGGQHGVLTDLLTRPDGTRETPHNGGDGHHSRALVNETCTDLGDQEDVRRGAHNPEVAGSNPPRYQEVQVRGLIATEAFGP